MLSRRFVTALAALAASAATRADASAGDPSRVVYHLSDRDKVVFTLGNIANHYAGMSDSQVVIALVVHGPALEVFRRNPPSFEVSDPFSVLVESGLAPHACINSRRAAGLDLDGLLPGFRIAEKGGVVRLAELQASGHAYIRP